MSKEDFIHRLLSELKDSQDFKRGRPSTVAAVKALEDALLKLATLRN